MCNHSLLFVSFAGGSGGTSYKQKLSVNLYIQDFEIIGKTGKIIRLIKVMRILRVYKLVRHFAGLQSLFYTLQQAYKELGLLFILVAVAILTFSSLVYFAEKLHDQEHDGEIKNTMKLVSQLVSF